MNNTAIAIISAIFIGIGSWLLSSFTCGAGTSNAAQFSVMDGSLKTNATDAYTFGIAGTRPNIPKSTETEMKKVANHLKSNDARMLGLVGTYYTSEKGAGDRDLGMIRAEAIKSKLVKLGAPENNITTSSQKLNNFPNTDKLYNPVDFKFMEKKTEAVSEVIEEDAGATRSILDPYTLRFKTGDSSLSMDSDLRSYLDRALAYLKENPGTVLMVTGHTDNTGASSANARLSKSRASKVRRFLRKNGVKSEEVKYQGKGQTDPIASNDTAEGRQQNRRVEIAIVNQ